MGDMHLELAALLGHVRNRWRALTALRAWSRGAAMAAGLLALALLAHRLVHPEGVALVLLWAAAAAAVLTILVASMAPVRRTPHDLQMARFIEERCPELEDALVTAVGQPAPGDGPMAAAVLHDAARLSRLLDRDAIVSRQTLKRTGLIAAAASAAFVLGTGFSAGPAGDAARVAGVYFFPERLALEVTPGDVKIRAGESLRVVARTSGGTSIVPVLRMRDGDEWRESRMEASADGYAVTIDAVEQDFQYLVAAAGTSTREYTVTVLRPPRVERIDLRY